MVQVSPPRRKGLTFAAVPDRMSMVEAQLLGRAMARWAPLDEQARKRAEAAAEAAAGQAYLDLYGITDAAQFNPHHLWDRLTPAERLRVPLGPGVTLDFKEDAEGGHGPHGRLTGRTGSGKSKTLRSMILSLAMTHSPEALRILLGDFKGEAEFDGLALLPHVVGLVSNLEGSAYKLDKFRDILLGELAIRDKVLNEAHYDSVRDYEIARATTKPDLEPIGALLIIIDEFSELLKMRPEMGKVFDTVGLQGRSKWVHILTASQRTEAGKMQGLLAQETFQIGMKVKDAQESMLAVGSRRCFEEITLRNAPPGTGFLVVDGEHTKFHSYLTKAPYRAWSPERRRTATEGNFVDAHLFIAAVTPLPDGVVAEAAPVELAEAEPGVDAATVESVLVAQIVKHGGHMKKTIWLPPLDDTREIPLDVLATQYWGLPWNELDESPQALRVPYARVDDPYWHTQDIATLDLSGPLGNVLVAGATGSGKSIAVCTMVMALALSHRPGDVAVYGLDFGGGRLSRLEGLAHVCGIAARGADERARRVVAEVERVMRYRIRNWAAMDATEFRARRARGEPVPDDGHGDVFLIVDGIRALRDAHPDLHDRIVAISEGGLNYAVHLIVTADAWLTVNTSLEGKLRSSVELRLEHPEHTRAIDKMVAKTVPNQPGRGVLREGNHLLVGAPWFTRNDSELKATESTVAAVTGMWAGRGAAPAPRLRVLPAHVGYDELPAPSGGVLKLGVGENELDTVGADLSQAPHFYACGSARSGRTTVLRTLLRSIGSTYAPPDAQNPHAGQAQVILFDGPGYELADAIDPRYIAAHAAGIKDIEAICKEVAEVMAKRQPPRELADKPAELARWRPDLPLCFVVVDDLNLLTHTGTTTSALLPLTDAVSRGRQIGFHVLAATSVDRWYATGKMNKVLAALDLAGAGVLVMDGNHNEGNIVDAVRAAPRAPGRGELHYRKGGSELVQVATT